MIEMSAGNSGYIPTKKLRWYDVQYVELKTVSNEYIQYWDTKDQPNNTISKAFVDLVQIKDIMGDLFVSTGWFGEPIHAIRYKTKDIKYIYVKVDEKLDYLLIPYLKNKGIIWTVHQEED